MGSAPRLPAYRLLSLLLFVTVLGGCAHRGSPAPLSGRGPVMLDETISPAADSYTVQRGDTLHSIAFRHGVDSRELVRLNAIRDPNTIYVGQTLRLNAEREPSTSTAHSPVTVSPARGGAAPVTSTPARRPGQAVVVATPIASPPAHSMTADPTPRNSPRVISDVDDRKQVTKWIWPANGRLVGQFSAGGQGNKGIDIAGNTGEAVLAAADGQVVYSGSGLRGYGQLIIIKHSSELLSAYAHNSKLYVEENQVVKAGQRIADMGNSGADSTKLHFEVRYQGKPVDPLKYLPRR